MRIWIVNHYAYAPFHSAGTRHWSFGRELQARGYEVLVITTSFFHKTREETVLEADETFKHENVEGVPYLWLRSPPYAGNTIRRAWNMIVFAARVWRQKGFPAQGPDVILGSSPDLFAAYAAYRVAKRRRVPFVLEIRDLWPDLLLEVGDMSPRHPFILILGALERMLYRSSDLVVSVMPGASDPIVRKGGSRDRLLILPNSVDLSMVPEPTPPADEGELRFMYAGAHGPAQGLDTLLDAARLIRDEAWAGKVVIELVGDGPEKDRLRQRAEAGAVTNVRFRDPVPKSEVYKVMREAHAFILPLVDSPVFQWGVSPNKLFDYLATARPVIFAVNSPFNPVADAQAGPTVAAEDPAALADGIRSLAEMEPGARWEMGLRGRKHVEERFDIRRIVDKLEVTLEDLVAKKLRSRPGLGD